MTSVRATSASADEIQYGGLNLQHLMGIRTRSFSGRVRLEHSHALWPPD